MPESLKERLSQALPDMTATDLHAVAAFAEFLANRRPTQAPNDDKELSEEEHAQMLAALDAVASLSLEQGPPVSNRDHDRFLYGAN